MFAFLNRFPVNTFVHCALLSKGPLTVCFSADKLKEVLVAHRGDSGELKVSPDGLARIDFTGSDFESTYWLVMLQN